MKDVDFLEYFLSVVEGLPPRLGQAAESVPLIADSLAPVVYALTVVVEKSAEKQIKQQSV
jgi:hypothetical protein